MSENGGDSPAAAATTTTNESASAERETEEKETEKENATPRKDSESSESSKTPTGTKIAFREQFKAFSKFGDTKSDGKHITLSQSDKWMKQAKVIDGKNITTTDTGIHFKKFKSLKISFEDYKKFVANLAQAKKVALEDVEMKLSTCGSPGLHGVTSNSKIDSTVERLTDVSKYTGSHKQRFDDSGKGKGIAGRKDIVDTSGYVSGYQNKDTYSKTH